MAPEPMHPSLLPYHPERDVYRLLQISPSASRDEVTAACRRLARTFHPDRNRSPRANDEMGVINAVRDMLVDDRERAAYDRARSRFLSGWTPGTARAAEVASAPLSAAAGKAERGDEVRGWRSLPAVVERTLRALVAAFRAVLGQFGPTFCPNCGATADAEYLYCAGCGVRLRRAGRLTFG
jgi:curved DNA-binding protein CbpA